MKYLGNNIVFVVIYLVFMGPTYLLPYVGSNSSITAAVSVAGEQGLLPATIFHFICLVVLIVVTWFRGTLVKAQWIVILPIIAAIFDMAPGLSLIPMVPTIMHIFALIKGASLKAPEIVTTESA